MYESTDQNVSHPGHYQSKTGLEVIDVIEAFTDGLEGIEATDTGNIIKYICRWKKKNGLQDLEKALWYLQHLVDHVKTTPDPKADVPRVKYVCKICSEPIFVDPFDTQEIGFLFNHLESVHDIRLKNTRTASAVVYNYYEKENV